MKKRSKPYKDSTYSRNSLVSAPKEIENLYLSLKKEVQEKLDHFEQQLRTFSKKKEEILLPISVFKTKLSPLEVIVKYLKEEKQLRFSAIAKFLKRDDRTIWHAYHRATKKRIRLKIKESKIEVPSALFANRYYSCLEILVSYLKENYQLSFKEIGVMLDRSPKTVWTAHNRAQKKHGRG